MRYGLTSSDQKAYHMRTVSVTLAKAQLTSLLRAAESGQTVLICRDGKPVAKLTAADEAYRPIDWEAGYAHLESQGIDWSGVHIPDDFNQMGGESGLE
jgi:prevent-host-death family protein